MATRLVDHNINFQIANVDDSRCLCQGFVCVDIDGETALVNKIPLIENRIQNLA